MKMVIAAIYFCAAMHYPSNEWSKYSNCTFFVSRYLTGESRDKLSLSQSSILNLLLDQDQKPLLMHMIQYNLLDPENMTQMTWPGSNPDLGYICVYVIAFLLALAAENLIQFIEIIQLTRT